MAGKKQQPTMPIAQKVLEQPLDRVMHQSMIPYAEYVIMDILWPDFRPEDLNAALWEYANRSRRFGGV